MYHMDIYDIYIYTHTLYPLVYPNYINLSLAGSTSSFPIYTTNWVDPQVT